MWDTTVQINRGSKRYMGECTEGAHMYGRLTDAQGHIDVQGMYRHIGQTDVQGAYSHTVGMQTYRGVFRCMG